MAPAPPPTVPTAPAAARATAAAFPGFRFVESGPAGGQVWRGTIPGAQQPMLVYLPPRYRPASRYPTVFLLHGMPGSPWSYVASMHLATVADRMVAGGATPFVAVVPAAGPNGRYNGEWAGYWEQWLVNDVVPWTKRHVRTGPLTIAGLSAGGYGAVDIALRHPTLFQRVESWGGYFAPLADGPLLGAAPPLLARHDPSLLLAHDASLLRRLRVQFFLSSGPAHGTVTPAETLRFAARLGALKIPYTLRLYSDARTMWQAQMDAGLAYAYATPHAHTARA